MQNIEPSNSILVSVVVVSYNSERTIVETLDSIKVQTYQNIELIISDDGSKDSTLALCKEWISNNSKSFQRVLLQTSGINTGISANGNRGCFECQGEWIKIIAADDILLPSCIRRNVEFVQSNPQYDFIFSKAKGLGNIKAYKRWPFKDVQPLFDSLSHDEQFLLLCQKNFLPTPTAFFRARSFRELGGYDETIPYLEDRPLWLKAYRKFYKFGFLPEYTVAYRFSENSISQKESQSDKRQLFDESGQKLKRLTKRYLQSYSISSWCYCKTSSLLGKWSLFLNVFNPFFYKNRRIIKLFNLFVESARNTTKD